MGWHISSHRFSSERHSAYRLGTVVIEYKWHPMYGQRVPVMRRVRSGGKEFVHVELRAGIWREVPVWMTEASTCEPHSLGPPQVSVGALNELRALLSDSSTERSGGESSDKANQGESDETTVKTITRPVQARPVSRATPGVRRIKEKGITRRPGGFTPGGSRWKSKRKRRQKGQRR